MSEVELYRFEELAEQVSKLQHNFEGLSVVAILALCFAFGCVFFCLGYWFIFLKE